MQYDAEAIVDGMEGIVYVIDRSAKIVTVGRRHWNDFASSNGGANLLDGRGVIDHNLFDFIAGDEVKASYRSFIDAVLDKRARAARLVSRCDSPGNERELLISFTPICDPDGGVEGVLIQSCTIGERPRPPINLFDFQAIEARVRAERSLPILTMCSYCQSVRYPVGSDDQTGRWIEAAEYYRLGGDHRVRISHGLCPACFARAEEALAA